MGGKGSGGYNRKSIEQHIRDGTYRIDRHGPVPGRLAAKITSDVERFRKEMEAGAGVQDGGRAVKASKTAKKDKNSPLPAKQKGLAAKDAFGGDQKGKGEQTKKDQEKVETPIVCPDWFDEYAKAEFVRVCQVLHDIGALQDVNHATLEGYCAAYSRAVRAEIELVDGFETETDVVLKSGVSITVTKKKTEVGVAEKAWMQVKTFAVELGITSSKGPQEPPEEGLTPLEKALRAAERKPR